ncbi:MAG: class IIb bacteriocin, lactobin A/cerein 7B family [Ekhidna sp.]|nr:class IIb bacteriocin, lactobin A/cerein 7B family [Ekhidna sp.]
MENLENLNLVELKKTELQDIEGGILPVLIVFGVLMLLPLAAR